MTVTEAGTLTCLTALADEGERLRIFDEELLVKVSGAETGGAYALIVGSVAPGGGPPLHAHPCSETLYVLSGAFAFTQRAADGVVTTEGGPGTVFHAPGGAPHRFENVGATRGELLIAGGAELVPFLRETAAAFPPGSAPDMERMLSINARYGVQTFHGEAGSRPEPPRAGATSARARALAWRFTQANDALIALIERCSAAQWQARCADTGWSVAVQAHHLAVSQPPIMDVIRDASAGQPHPPLPVTLLDEINARHAAECANVTIAETAELLRRNGAAAAEVYRALTDEQLARTATLMAGGPEASVDTIIEELAIGELVRHGDYIRRACGR